MTQEWISEFNPASEEQWKLQLLKELKGDSSKLEIQNKLEEINYSTFYHPENQKKQLSESNSLPIQRGFQKSTNLWRNGIQLTITNEKEANKKALQALMQGCDFIHFVSTGSTNWQQTLEGIGFAYIHTTFTLTDPTELQELIQVIGQENINHCSFDLPEECTDITKIKDLIKYNQFPVFQIDGFSINQCGANAIQELGFVAVQAHSRLVQLMNLGLSIDEAAACIHIRLGVGTNYFVEIAKFRAVKIIWANILKHYSPVHNCSYNCQITAEIGWVNKSLKDPNTNLLRQTTEAMSAIVGGIDRMIIHPFDACSENGSSEFTQRMALNISNLLQDESYFSAVADPLGGSYAIEALTEEMSVESWNLFKQMDALPEETQKLKWKELVEDKAKQRIEFIRISKSILIGINKFTNLKLEDTNWAKAKTFNDMNFLRLETEIQ
jgi:methylmalonyl-CoA mutase